MWAKCLHSIKLVGVYKLMDNLPEEFRCTACHSLIIPSQKPDEYKRALNGECRLCPDKPHKIHRRKQK